MKKKIKSCLSVAVATLALTGVSARADQMGGQVFYRFGYSMLGKDRGNQVFTDTNGATTKNDDKNGWNIGAGLNLPLAKDFASGTLLGEIMADYSRYSRKKVTQTTSALLGGTNQSNVTVSEMKIVIAPKYKMSFMDGKLSPWLIPAGLAFLVNSPPSNDANYLDIGYHAGLGVEYAVVSMLSVGLDYRYTFAAAESGVDMSAGQIDFYLGINF